MSADQVVVVVAPDVTLFRAQILQLLAAIARIDELQRARDRAARRRRIHGRRVDTALRVRDRRSARRRRRVRP